MKNLITFRNRKLKTDNIGAFKLPAGKTCPYAGECREWCYAKCGAFRYPIVKKFQELGFTASRKDTFIERMVDEIRMWKDKGKLFALRLHTAGDFYSQEYFDKWLAIAYRVPDVLIYTYTKSLPYIRWDKLPDNFIIIQSDGGRCKIDKRRKHAVVFASEQLASKAGYVVCDVSEKVAIAERKIALIIHGDNKKFFGGTI